MGRSTRTKAVTSCKTASKSKSIKMAKTPKATGSKAVTKKVTAVEEPDEMAYE